MSDQASFDKRTIRAKEAAYKRQRRPKRLRPVRNLPPTAPRLSPPLLGCLLLCICIASCSGAASKVGSSNGRGTNGVQDQSYSPTFSTTFSATENPISERGKWVDGGTVGLDWDKVQTTRNFAFGTLPTGKYTDPTAILTGSWAPNQTARATVHIKSVKKSCCHEVELRLRTTIMAHSITGYEINCSVATENPYVAITRWNGPINNFTPLRDSHRTGCADRDVLQATITGSTITVYKNGTLVLQVNDSIYTSGSPGIGFYETDNNVGYYGFSDFSASSVALQSENSSTDHSTR